MVQKRPLGEEPYKVSSKQPRQLEDSNQLVSVLEFPCEYVVEKSYNSGEHKHGRTNHCGGSMKFDGCDFSGWPISIEGDTQTSVPGCMSNSSYTTSSRSEEDFGTEAPFHLLFSSFNYNSDNLVRTVVHSEDTYFKNLEYHPRKLVPIGLDFQADIPKWDELAAKKTFTCPFTSDASSLSSQALTTELIDHVHDENKLAGTCVIPFLESEPSAHNGNEVGVGRSDCCCEDMGSVRCVRQHIKESREKLRGTLGLETYATLGFYHMGEVVSEKWSGEDEQLFREVVFSNSASMGRNFWNHLSTAFPFLSKEEIVSYYFNVFVLQRRAEQNRCDPLNIDSDNDEWQGGDDCGGIEVDDEVDEVGVANEDKDSAVGSPVYAHDAVCDDICDDNSHEYYEDVANVNCEIYDDAGYCRKRDIGSVSEIFSRKFFNQCGSDPTCRLRHTVLCEENVDHDAHDDSCMAVDNGSASLVTNVEADDGKHYSGVSNGMAGGSSHEFDQESTDSQVWNVEFPTCLRNEVDFLPTCTMIKEVFGAETLTGKAADNENLR